jgi:hypothetical protein
LLRKSRWRSTVIAWYSVVVHLGASFGLLLVADGTELNADLERRHQWIVESTGIWIATWSLWALSSISLLAICLAWSNQLQRARKRPAVSIGCAIIAIGVCFDLSGETVMIVQSTRHDLTAYGFASTARLYQLLSPAIANGTYPIGGLILSYVAWKTGQLRGIAGAAGFAMWFIAFLLTLATLVSHTFVMTASGAMIMVLYLPWATTLGWRLRGE